MTCNRRRYASEGDANSVLYVIRARDAEAGDRLEVQPCAECSGYHVQRKAEPIPPPVIAGPRRGRPSLPYKDDD